jgi:hypothetical protein
MTPCIEHTGCIQNTGYGQVRREGKTWSAHRWAAHVAFGGIPEGQVVRHKCDNKLCVNPEHLEFGAQRDNLLDRRERTRYLKLTRQDVEGIKHGLAEGKVLRVLAEQYGVSIQMIHHIKTGKQWS